jgi:hypothetical protein
VKRSFDGVDGLVDALLDGVDGLLDALLDGVDGRRRAVRRATPACYRAASA